jgi:tetratricopeptide (TPR) repeat protein
MKAVLQLPDVKSSDLAHAWALYVSAQLAESQSDFAEARRMLELCLPLRRGLANPVEVAATLSALATVRLHTGEVAAAKDCELEALEIFRELGDRQGEAISLLHLGQLASHLGNDQEALALLGQAHAIAREIKYQELETVCDLAHGELSFEAANFVQAATWLSRGYTVARDAADKRGEANALRWLGASDLQAGNLSSARNRLTESMQALRKLEMWDELLGCLEEYAELLNAEGDLTLAVRITAAAVKARARLGLVRSPRAEQRLRSRVAGYRERATGFNDDWNLGEGWSVDDAILSALKPATASTSAAPRETAVQATQ